MPRFTTVIFDMDGLMLDTERLYREVFRAGMADLGIAFTDDDFLRLVGRRTEDWQRALYDQHGPHFPMDRLMDRCRVHDARLLGTGPLPLKAGLLDLLDWLETQDIRKVVATSTGSPRAQQKLERSEILHRFASVTTGDTVARGKPAPDIFLAAAASVAADPAACVVLEDSEPGIEGAHAAGMTPIMVPDLLQPCDETRGRCHAVVESLNEVKRLLDEWTGMPSTR